MLIPENTHKNVCACVRAGVHVCAYVRGNLMTYRFLDFFFFVPSGLTSQLQGDPELS